MIVKELITGDISPVAMFSFLHPIETGYILKKTESLQKVLWKAQNILIFLVLIKSGLKNVRTFCAF